MSRFLCFIVASLCAVGAAGQSRSGGPKPPAPADVRHVDFLDFTYPSPMCSREFGRQGIGRSVRVKHGDLKTKRAFVSVDEKRIVYGDVNGDGIEEAIVPVTCGSIGANYSRTEVYVYSLHDGRTRLVGTITDRDLERDCRRYYGEVESYWGEAGTAITVHDGTIDIDTLIDGPHAAPRYIATIGYHLMGKGFQATGTPKRRDAPQ